MSRRRDESVGRVILGRYRVVLQLGRGGQGAVYLARGEGAAGFARPVVVKRILAPFARDPEILDQFAREARITAQLRHPCIVSVIDFAHDSDSHVMVLEYVHGYDLRRWERYVRRIHGHFAPDLVSYPVLRVLDALHYAHTLRGPDGADRRVIHRDVSPANVLIDVEGHVKLTDFGIARMADEVITADTSTVRLKGKLPYLAPEMFKGAGPSEQTDLYACGVMLHELLIGKNEFHAASAVESMARVAGHIPTRVDAVRPNLPAAFADVVARSLAKDPEHRYQSALEFSNALRNVFPEDDATLAQRFRDAISADFNDSRCAQITGSAPLAELDAAWRREPSDRSLAEHARSSVDGVALSGDVETLVDFDAELAPAANADLEPLVVGAKQSAPRRRFSWTLLAAALVGGALVAQVLGLFEKREPQFVYVDKQVLTRNVDGAGRGQEPVPSQPASESQLAATTSPVAREPVKAQPASHADRLTRAFAQRRAAVEACFQHFQVSPEERDHLLVQFSVDRNGRVRSAGLIPDSLSSTPFGRCVIRAAASTKFGPQASAIAFRIPITARRTAR